MELVVSRFDCVIYDFDGVVLDTAQLKVDAFCQVYQQEDPDLVEAVRTFADNNGGMSRYEKFRHFEVSVFGRLGDPAAIDALCASYGRFVDDGVSKAAYINGAPECFAAIGPLAEQHIVSAAPENDVLTALRERDILHHFQSVSGAPKAKLIAFERILASSQLDARRVLAIGDSLAEYSAATQLGMPFLAIVGPDVKDRFPPETRRMQDLTEVTSLL
jgi:phosphoglycolate phosphatase-like HAD superfamily hydrolase